MGKNKGISPGDFLRKKKLLQSTYKSFIIKYDDGREVDLCGLLRDYASEYDFTSRWVNVKNELPKKNTPVLLRVNGNIIQGEYTPDSSYKKWDFIVLDTHGCGCCAGSEDEVTEWMELP